MNATARYGLLAASLTLLAGATAPVVEAARQAGPARVPAAPAVQSSQPARPPAATPAAPAREDEDVSANADDTRQAFRAVLDRYSPSVGRVLALDPLLLQNPGYLEPYPDIRAFLAQHPEVGRDVSFYLAGYAQSYNRPLDHDSQVMRMWNDLFAGLAVLTIICLVTGTLVWLIKTLIDYRRWSRLSKVQTDAHNKLLDRFSANEELLSYIATPSGRRFLESAPIMLDTSAASIGVPAKRILWAVEIGVVLACGAGGLLVARRFVPTEIGQGLSVVGVVVAALGLGFIVAALASYFISRRLGVLPYAPSAGVADTDARPVA
jgi:hypothetical protein